MNLDDFSTVVDDRRYINPQVGLDESNAFIENLRNTQQANTQQIAQDTYNLGTAVPSNLGGLGGAGSYFTSRYQTPQTNEVIGNLRATAQAQALNEALGNKLAQAKERYNQAYRRAQKRAGSNAPGTPAAPPTTGGDGSDYFNIPGQDGGKVNLNPNEGAVGTLNADNRGTYYQGNLGTKYYLRNLNAGERLTWNQLEQQPKSGTFRIGNNNVQYLFVKNPQTGEGKWYAVTGTN